ncbi:MAG TPA: biotin carboxylase, partial [Balneolaceae bacterium]|nr:biotin carboxylase [Balneolaceae bacterium]
MAHIKKILIANRGEIALRVIHTCKELGIKTVAVYSRPDAHSPHVLHADEAVFIGEAASSESYLVMDKIIDAARQTGADAIHPGYGFLSENAAFAERCDKEGVIFIGPRPKAIRLMGDKTEARELMSQHKIPTPPGLKSELKDIEEARRVADEIGYPILVKAAAGGGGKGMRIVHKKEEFEASIKAAKSEALNAFGDDRIYIEKYLEEPRHVEFQIIADTHGNVLHVYDRECSIQRRHQKVIEEA